MEENVDRLPVPDVLSGPLLAKSQQRGRGKGQKLFQPIFNVVMASDGEETAKQLINSHSKAVNVVGMPLQLCLVCT